MLKSFLERTKLEQRQEHYEQDVLFSHHNKSTRPVFLDKILAAGNAPTSHQATYDLFGSRHEQRSNSPDKLIEKRQSIKDDFFYKSSDEEDLGAGDEEPSVNLEKLKIVRRRSCCCKWCGGISALENKNQDIISDLQKYGRVTTPEPEPEVQEGENEAGGKEGKRWGKVKIIANLASRMGSLNRDIIEKNSQKRRQSVANLEFIKQARRGTVAVSSISPGKRSSVMLKGSGFFTFDQKKVKGSQKREIRTEKSLDSPKYLDGITPIREKQSQFADKAGQGQHRVIKTPKINPLPLDNSILGNSKVAQNNTPSMKIPQSQVISPRNNVKHLTHDGMLSDRNLKTPEYNDIFSPPATSKGHMRTVSEIYNNQMIRSQVIFKRPTVKKTTSPKKTSKVKLSDSKISSMSQTYLPALVSPRTKKITVKGNTFSPREEMNSTLKVPKKKNIHATLGDLNIESAVTVETFYSPTPDMMNGMVVRDQTRSNTHKTTLISNQSKKLKIDTAELLIATSPYKKSPKAIVLTKFPITSPRKSVASLKPGNKIDLKKTVSAAMSPRREMNYETSQNLTTIAVSKVNLTEYLNG